MFGWLRRNWWMIIAVMAGPVLTVGTLLLVRWLGLDEGRTRELPEGTDS